MPSRRVPVPRQMMISAMTQKADDTPRTSPLAIAADGGWCCDVQRIPIAESATTIEVKAVIASRTPCLGFSVNGSGERA